MLLLLSMTMMVCPPWWLCPTMPVSVDTEYVSASHACSMAEWLIQVMIIHHVQSCYPRPLVLHHNGPGLQPEIGTEKNDQKLLTIVAMTLLIRTLSTPAATPVAVITTTTTEIVTTHQKHGGVPANKLSLSPHIQNRTWFVWLFLLNARHPNSTALSLTH